MKAISTTILQPRRPATLLLCAVLALAGPAGAQEEPPAEEEASPWAEVRAAYEKAKLRARAMGESLPDKVPDWVKEDLANVGDWQYLVVEVPRGELEARLNELGAERWECFSVEPMGRKTQLVFKRRKRSQLRELQDLSADDLLTVLKLLKGEIGKGE